MKTVELISPDREHLLAVLIFLAQQGDKTAQAKLEAAAPQLIITRTFK